MTWKCSTFEFDTKMPILMGILNVTPDSFSDGGSYTDIDAALTHAEAMCEAGAAIIDVGGESTRPGAIEVAPDEEWERIAEVIRQLAARGVCVSVDTRHASVAARALEVGASIVNDVSGFTDPEMVTVASAHDCGCVIMHMKGEPATMQKNPVYADVVDEVREFLRTQASMLEAAGIARERICVDPGPGFGKTPAQTIELMRNFHEFARLGYTTMCAASRKRFLNTAYHLEDPSMHERDAASAAEALLACELGAQVVRTHNVEMTRIGLQELRPYVLLGLGSNVALVADDDEVEEAKKAQINHAIGQMCILPDTQIIDIASFYGSEPAYYADQEDFVNTVVLARTGLPPRELLEHLHRIENSLGRTRTIANGPRTIDIDILDYQLYDFATDDLALPHPRVCERDFVVKPLLEVRPGHVLANGVAVDSVPEQERVGKAHKL